MLAWTDGFRQFARWAGVAGDQSCVASLPQGRILRICDPKAEGRTSGGMYVALASEGGLRCACRDARPRLMWQWRRWRRWRRGDTRQRQDRADHVRDRQGHGRVGAADDRQVEHCAPRPEGHADRAARVGQRPAQPDGDHAPGQERPVRDPLHRRGLDRRVRQVRLARGDPQGPDPRVRHHAQGPGRQRHLRGQDLGRPGRERRRDALLPQGHPRQGGQEGPHHLGRAGRHGQDDRAQVQDGRLLRAVLQVRGPDGQRHGGDLGRRRSPRRPSPTRRRRAGAPSSRASCSSCATGRTSTRWRTRPARSPRSPASSRSPRCPARARSAATTTRSASSPRTRRPRSSSSSSSPRRSSSAPAWRSRSRR